jgi:cell division protein FtsI (penicillin-binding protein 3)
MWKNVGQEGVELSFNPKNCRAVPGSRRVIKDRLGPRVIEDVRDATVPPVDGPDLQLSIDSKIQFFAHQKLREAVVTPTRQRPEVWW